MENMLKLGPNQTKGSIWDDGGKTKIVQILISYGRQTVYSIQFVSAVNGKMLPSEVHGKPSGRKFDIVTIDDPEEYLTSVSGQHGINKLVSVTFGTNKRKYGPFGSVIKGSSLPPFVYNFSPKSSFGGFHGSVYKSCLCSIGVYVRPLGSIAETETEIDIGSDRSEDDHMSTCSK
ncbi:hypothetical protein L2E82_06100 [Cichorium intybus]|uniref:Uncharacterized protein n=1 Tax=Cichorium intybus TaxID=13427 RepID=A0ACB9HA78_CICIN|nr:hypothetical protein L2E82_06100 [Cichorium intybus]